MPEKNVTIDRPGKSRVVCTVEVEETSKQQAEQEALKRLGGSVRIKGFRPGHAPADMIRSSIPAEQLHEETVRLLLRNILPQLVQEHDVRPIIPPRVETVSLSPLTIRIVIIERPQATVKKIDAFSIERKEVSADQKDVDRIIQSVLREHRTVKETDRPAQDGDEVVIDFEATDESGAPIASLQSTNYEVHIGSKTLIPGLEEALIGMKSGDTKNCTLTLPEKFGIAELAGKKAAFALRMHTVKEVQMPTLDDAFAQKNLQTRTAEEFTEFVKQTVAQQEESMERMRRERLLMEEITNRTMVELPDELLDEEVRSIVQDWSDRLSQRGSSIADALQAQGKKAEDVEKEMREEAIKRWKLRLGLAAIIEQQKITLEEDALEERFADALADAPEERRRELQKEWDARGTIYEEVRWRMLVDRAVDALLD